MISFGITLSVFFLFVMVYLWQHFSAIEYGYRIEQVKAQRDTIVGINRALNLEEASLKDLARIERLATQMGMHRPVDGQWQPMDTGYADPSTPVMAQGERNHGGFAAAVGLASHRARQVNPRSGIPSGGPPATDRLLHVVTQQKPSISGASRSRNGVKRNAGKRSQDATRRLYILAALLCLWILAICFRLVRLQVVKYGFFVQLAHRQQNRTIPVDPRRGNIYDRNGHPLAMSIDVDSVFAVPSEVHDQETTALILGKVLNLDPQEIVARIESSRNFRLDQPQGRCRNQRSRSRTEPARDLLPQGAQALLSQARTGGAGPRLRRHG